MDISLVIPAFNESESLPELVSWIDRVMSENKFTYEVLFINDGSTDDSVEIMQKYASDPRVSLINDGVNKGLVFRLNESTHLAKGKYYARMDADDIMHPDRLQKQVDYMEEHANVDVLGTGCYIIDLNNKITPG